MGADTAHDERGAGVTGVSATRLRAVRALAIALTLAPVVLLTLLPAGGEKIGAGWQLCLVCGATGAAAAILNVVLFVPYGGALGGTRLRWYVCVLAAALTSVGIEAAQQALPGRNPTLGDIVFNTIGAAIGVVAWRSWRHWMTPAASAANRLVLAAATIFVLVIAATSYAARPMFPDALYFGLWTPDLRHLQHYDGQVGAAAVNGLAVPRGAPFANRDEAVRTVADWNRVQVSAVAGSRPSALAPIVAVFDSARHEVLLVGIDRDDVVLRYRRRAAGMRLMDPQVRLAGAAALLEPGRPLEFDVQRIGTRHCIEAGSARRCGLGTTAGHGWTLLRQAGTVPARFDSLAAALWIALLALPIGYWIRASAAGLAALLLTVTSLAAVPLAGTLVPTPPEQWLAAALAVLAGGGAAARVKRWRRFDLSHISVASVPQSTLETAAATGEDGA